VAATHWFQPERANFSQQRKSTVREYELDCTGAAVRLIPAATVALRALLRLFTQANTVVRDL